MPAGWQRSNWELVPLLRFLLFISSLSIFCLVNLVKAELEIRFLCVCVCVWHLCHYFWSCMAWGGVYSLRKQDFRHGKFAEEFIVGSDVLGCSGLTQGHILSQILSLPRTEIQKSQLDSSLFSLLWAKEALHLAKCKLRGTENCSSLLLWQIQRYFPLYPPNNNTQKNPFPPGKGRKTSRPAGG